MSLRGVRYVERTEAVSRILRSYRALAGLTQSELADRLGVVQSLVSKVESRERRLDLVELQEYLVPLGRTVHDVVADLERMVADSASPARAGSSDGLREPRPDLAFGDMVRAVGDVIGATSDRREDVGEGVVELTRQDGSSHVVVLDMDRIPTALRRQIRESMDGGGAASDR